MEDIYRKHERLMYYIAGKYSEVSVQREDIVQTAVLSLLKNEATLQRLPPYAQINYIAAAVRNTAINTIKRDQKETARCIPLDDLTEDFPQAHIPGAEVRYLERKTGRTVNRLSGNTRRRKATVVRKISDGSVGHRTCANARL